jgi:hypothetical protein
VATEIRTANCQKHVKNVIARTNLLSISENLRFIQEKHILVRVLVCIIEEESFVCGRLSVGKAIRGEKSQPQ